ncbi:MAG: dihydroneopterin aldolase [Hydrogenibacillus sp.]|nr:dihydroneopterin aldolase [Hydrogenibacillus sp.]
MDRLILSGLEFFARHGVYPAEQEKGGRFRVDVEALADLGPAGETDDLAQTVDYSQLYAAVERVMTQTRAKLLERVAEDIARAVLAEFPMIRRVIVAVYKVDPPFAGHIERLGVKIDRARDATS